MSEVASVIRIDRHCVFKVANPCVSRIDWITHAKD